MTKISTSEIKANSAHIRNEVEFLNSVITRMDEVKEELANAWTDSTTQQTAEKYLNDISEKQADLKKMVAKIAELPEHLDRAADNYQNAGMGGQL